MAGPEETPDVPSAEVKRPAVDIESLQRKKFKTEELPLSPTQHRTIEDLLHAFKKRGGFDTTRKKLWTEFDEGVCLVVNSFYILLLSRTRLFPC